MILNQVKLFINYYFVVQNKRRGEFYLKRIKRRKLL